MVICPICNGIEEVEDRCPDCSNQMVDHGKIVDYLDDYSPYLEVMLTKMVDGDPDSATVQQCIHVIQCVECGKIMTKGIQEAAY
ncbi:hypothetical protein [Thalassobacillus devorans]|uniref:hypothetical protein n=1 Tax=Thalassobacillus devorans TaxID=279813 RepID=UPI000A1CCD36|nr:hypothetical protein [Thalassobacillus devorans]